MFSKKPQLAVQSATPTPADALGVRIKKFVAPLTNPYIGASAAALLLVLSIAALVAVGDPRAGAPTARVALIADSATTSVDGAVTVSGGREISARSAFPAPTSDRPPWLAA